MLTRDNEDDLHCLLDDDIIAVFAVMCKTANV